MMDLAGKRVVVVGLGSSGTAAARLCAARGARVVGTDTRPLEALPEAVRELGIAIAAGGHEGADLEGADLVVVSPGVPPLSVLTRAEDRGVEVIGELELATRFATVPVLAVGGTNGKSTVTTALAAMLRATGARVFSGGNLGTPVSEAVGTDAEVWVVEVSSFQLERAPTFRPRVSVLLNITEDHLDRYPSFAAYAAAKGNAFARQTPEDVAVIPVGDPICLEQASRGGARQITFGQDADYAVRGREVEERGTGVRFDLASSAFHGQPNLLNAAAALAAARTFGASEEAVRLALADFRPLPHRMARVACIGGVTYYDDSKATNVGAAVTALSGLAEGKVVLIAGGRDKQGAYDPLVEALRHKGRALVVVGEAAPRIARAAEGVLPILSVTSMEEAVARAAERAEPGDAVLLSPACSSFDEYASYAERGQAFVRAVRRLELGREGS
jgi:UDP-N-acetylmuramoylalanine--D-glutamate ligase